MTAASQHPIPASALDADIAIIGKKGRGKTFTAKGLVECLLRLHRRVLVLDPLSVWWGLKSGADGKSPGFSIPVFGGPHADIDLHEGAGTVIGELIVSSGTSAILDIGRMRKAEQARLVADLLDYLFTHNRDPLWLVLEEADAFAPQQPMGDLNRVLGEVDRIARRGRNFGFRLISITQRPAKLNKDVLTQLSTLITLGITSPQDREAVKAWVEGNADREKAKTVIDSLASLRVGEGWIWAPDHDILRRVTFPPISTLDTSRTPRAGDITISAPVLAAADLSKIAVQINEIQKAQLSAKSSNKKGQQQTADETAALRARIAELEAQQSQPEEVAELRALIQQRDRTIEDVQRLIAESNARRTVLETRLKDLHGLAVRLTTELDDARSELQMDTLPTITSFAPLEPGPRETAPRPKSDRHAKSDSRAHMAGSLPVGEAAILNVAIQSPNGATASQLSIQTRYKRSSRDAYVARLITRGFIAKKEGSIFATPAGRAALPDSKPLPRGRALQQYWLAKLPEGERVILETLLREAGPGKPLARKFLDGHYKRSSRDAYLQRLKARNLITIHGDGVAPAADLF